MPPRKRRQKAGKDARLETWAENRGTAAQARRDLPPAAVLAAGKHIDAAARALKAAGAGGTLEQLRAKVFLALLSGQPLDTLLPVHDQDKSNAQRGNGQRCTGDPGDGPGDGSADGSGGGGTRRPGPSGGAPDPAAPGSPAAPGHQAPTTQGFPG